MMVVASVALMAYALLPRKRDDQETILRRMTGRRVTDETELLRKQAKASVAQKLVEKMAPLATKPVMPKNAEELSKLNVKLANAGLRRDNAATLFLASKTIVAVLGGLATLIYMLSTGADLQHISGWTVVATAVGFMAPNIWLRMAVSRRAETIRNGLPDSLDLLVISVESGLGLDAAIQRVGDEMKHVHPVLSEEFQITTLESQMGIPRAEALGNMATRTGVAEIRSLVSIVNQAERFGTSIASALRNQANAQRVKRRQKAEERAQQTTVKLMAPLILFIFPAIFVVLAGPAALRLMDAMGSNGSL
ncbi:MAG: type II secretion system F family protein [Planctomycetes bacterium]|nr:type II secretion system F family protein [Planctomycetota bacterium]